MPKFWYGPCGGSPLPGVIVLESLTPTHDLPRSLSSANSMETLVKINAVSLARTELDARSLLLVRIAALVAVVCCMSGLRSTPA